jgi:hypothetical protein
MYRFNCSRDDQAKSRVAGAGNVGVERYFKRRPGRVVGLVGRFITTSKGCPISRLVLARYRRFSRSCASIRYFPHLAKNGPDMGHPLFVLFVVMKQLEPQQSLKNQIEIAFRVYGS